MPAARLLAALYLAVDPTDSYLHAATWGARATDAPPAPGAGPALLARVWTGWFGLGRADGGLACRLPEPAGDIPAARRLEGIPLRGGGAARVRVEGPRGRLEAAGRAWELEAGRTLRLPDL